MCLRHALPFQDRGYKRCCETVASPYRVGNLNLGRRLKRHVAWSEHIAAVYSAREYQHLKIILTEKNPAFVLEVDAGIAEHTAYSHQLLIVYLQDVASLHGIAKDFLVIEPLTQIHIKHYQILLIT